MVEKGDDVGIDAAIVRMNDTSLVQRLALRKLDPIRCALPPSSPPFLG
jgi:hypothetical protein